MTTSDWRGLLENSGGIERFYRSGPALSSCNLIYLHMDERGQSLTLNLESGDPFNPSREDENPTARNVVEFYLTFFGIKNLELDGWQNHAAKRIEMLKHRPDGPIYVTITGRDELVKFTADNASIIHSQAKRKAAE